MMLVAGLASLVAGLLLGESVAAIIGGLLMIAGAFFVVRGYLHGRTRPLTSVAPGADTFRARRALDTARSAWRAAADLRAAADAACSDATLAADTYVTRQALFVKRMTDAGLPAGTTPAAAAQTIALVRDARRASADLQAKRDAAAALQSRVDAFSARVAAAGTAALAITGAVEPDGVPGLVGRLKDALAGARDTGLRHTQQTDAARDLTERIKVAEQRVARGTEEAHTILVERGLEEGGSLAALREQLARAEAESVMPMLRTTRSPRSVRGFRVRSTRSRARTAARSFGCLKHQSANTSPTPSTATW